MSEKMKNVNKANLETFASCLKTNFETKTLNINKGDNTLQSTIKPGNINNLTYLDISGNVNFSTLTSSAYASRVSDSVSDGTRYDSSTDTLIKRPLWISAGTHRNNISGGLVKGVPNLSNPSELYFVADGANTGQGHLFAKRLRSNHIVADDFTSSGLFYMMVDSSNELNFKSSIGGNLHINYRGYEGVTPFNTICFNDGTSKGDSYSQLKFKINELTDNTNAPICLYAGNSVFKAPTSKLTLNPSEGSLNVGTKVTSPLFVGNLDGNASTSDKFSSEKDFDISTDDSLIHLRFTTDCSVNNYGDVVIKNNNSSCTTYNRYFIYISETGVPVAGGTVALSLELECISPYGIGTSWTQSTPIVANSVFGTLRNMFSEYGICYCIIRGTMGDKQVYANFIKKSTYGNNLRWDERIKSAYNFSIYSPDNSSPSFTITCTDGGTALISGSGSTQATTVQYFGRWVGNFT